MSKYQIGEKVIKTDTGKRGVVINVFPPRRGRQLYSVRWDGGEDTDELEVNLSPDCNISDPFERCLGGFFDSYSEYSKKNTTFKIRSSNNSTISSLKASKTLFRAYQFKPLLKFLNSPNRRLLVADEVGLGKTIEAGHIMLELKARRELRHVLIVCPKSLQRKWKEELDIKFGFKFKIYDAPKDLLDDIQDTRVPIHAIVNYEKIREKRRDKRDKASTETEPKDIVDFLAKKDFKFSLVLCDEAHKMRNSGTQTYKGAEIIMNHTDAALFLTATPVMISTLNLYNLLHLLDDVRFYNYQIFDNRLEENRPFVEALTELNHQVPLPDIAQKLSESEIRQRFFSNEVEIYSRQTSIKMAFDGNAMYQEIIQMMLQGEDTPKSRARLQYLLSSMSVMNNIFSRTRKREVTTDMSQAERKPHKRIVALSEAERERFDTVIEEYINDNSYTDWWGDDVMTKGSALGLVQKKRQVASSVYAYLNTERSLDLGIDEYAEYEDAKFEELLKIIDEVFRHGTKKIVIFALFRKTLKYLQIRFKSRGLGSLMIHGLVENRSEILNKFKNDPSAHILLSSEVGSEGLDMQFCNSMVNYDLPWNPMVVEQRIGRIDRFGQKSPVVNIYNIVVKDSIQEDIYDRLLDRIGIFRGTIGDLEAILDAPMGCNGENSIQQAYNDLEKELYTSHLSEEDKRRKIREIELAIANETENIKRLEEGLDNTLTNDAYFRDEINRIQNNNAYVTEIELRNYLESAIRQKMPTCSLLKADDDIYVLKLPMGDSRILQSFLTENQSDGEEAETSFRRFKQEIEGLQTIRMTFNQQKAYDDSQLLFMNIYHPLIQACMNYFVKYDDVAKTSFCYALAQDELLPKGATYYLILYRMRVTRKVLGVPKHTETLQPLLYDVTGRTIVKDEDLVNRVFSRSQTEGKEHNATKEAMNEEMIQDMRLDFAEEFAAMKEARKAEILLQVKSDQQQNGEQTRKYYDTLIENTNKSIRRQEEEIEMIYSEDEKRAKELRGSIRLAQANIQRLEEEKESRLAQIRETSQIEMDESIISLNLINII